MLVAMVIAGLTTQDLRARLCTPQISISGVVFVVMITPHYYWFFPDPAGAHSVEINHLHVGPSATYLSDVGKGLWSGAVQLLPF